MDEKTKEQIDVIVIGGGISGLTAARDIKKTGATVKVLEGRERVGGRTFSKVVEQDLVVDVGGAYVGPGQNRVLKMIRDLGLKTHVVYDEGKFVMNQDGKKILASDPHLPPLGLVTLLDLNAAINESDRLTSLIDLNNPLSHPDVTKFDSMTVQQWINSNLWTDYARKCYEDAVRTVLCTEPSEVSMAYWILYMKSGGSFNALSSTKKGAQERKIVGGSQQISIRLAENLDVEYESIVNKIQWKDNKVTIFCENGKVFSCSYCIIAFSPTLYNKIVFEPNLPSLKTQLSQRMPTGSIIKTVMYYQKPFWREKGLSGQILWNKGPIVYCIDDCKPDGSHPAIMGFILAKHARELSECSEEERKKLICAQYKEAFGSEEAMNPVRYCEFDWSSERLSGGCYVGYMPPGVMTSFYKHLKEPVGRIHFAGTETATEWIGYMDGAIQAGERAAYEVYLRLEKDQEYTKTNKLIKLQPPKEKEVVDPEINVQITKQFYESLLPSPKGLFIALFFTALAVGVKYIKSLNL